MQHIGTQEELPKLARILMHELCERRTNTLALHGDLGAGKTTLVAALAAVVGVTESVSSPTFIVYRAYSLPTAPSAHPHTSVWTKLVHVDAYRLEGELDAKKIKLHELCADPQNLVCIEWPEHIGAVVPQDALHVYLAYTKDNDLDTRIIEVR